MLAAAVTFTTTLTAQAPVQTAPAKVGVINSDKFANATGGITRLVNALRTLDAEFKPRRDEITQLLARFNALQQVPAASTPAQLASRRDQVETLQTEIQRKQEDARVAYGKRLSTLTNPIRLTVFNALEAYAKQRGLDVLIDLAKFPDGVLLVNQNADLTPGFIRDFNSKNP
jgi:Skp family chaperone for outer membrane proteins